MRIIAALLPVAVLALYWCVRTRTMPGRDSLLAFLVMLPVFGVLTVFECSTSQLIGRLPVGHWWRLILLFVILGAIPEEAARYLVLRGLLDGRNRSADALGMGLMASLGGAALENILYLATTTVWQPMALARGLATVPMHACCGLFMSACLLTAAGAPPVRARRWRWLAILLPATLHSCFDVLVLSISRGSGLALLTAAALAVLGGAAIVMQGQLLDASAPTKPDHASTGWQSVCAVPLGGAFLAIAMASGVRPPWPTADWRPLTMVLPTMPAILGADLLWAALRPRGRHSIARQFGAD